MNQAAQLSIEPTTVNSIIQLAKAVISDPDGERKLYSALAHLTPEERGHICFLYYLGRTITSPSLYEVQRQNPEQFARMLTAEANLATCLRAGLKGYKKILQEI